MEQMKQTLVNQDVACESCGRFGAVELGNHHLCIDCYEGCGSCCPEFGKDDLWEAEEEPAERHPAEPRKKD